MMSISVPFLRALGETSRRLLLFNRVEHFKVDSKHASTNGVEIFLLSTSTLTLKIMRKKDC